MHDGEKWPCQIFERGLLSQKRRAFLAGLEACLFTKIRCSKRSRGENFKEARGRESLTEDPLDRKSLHAGWDCVSDVLKSQCDVLRGSSALSLLSRSLCCESVTWLSKKPARARSRRDLFICLGSMDLSRINQASGSRFRPAIVNLLKMCVCLSVSSAVKNR